MKLLLVVIQDRDWPKVSDRLLEEGFQFTRIASTGGFLREGNITLLIGVEDEQVDTVLEVLQEECRTREQLVDTAPPVGEPYGTGLGMPMKVEVGGAIVFVLHVERFLRM